MNAEQQYIELFSQTEAMICKHSAEVLNAPRAAAFADFERVGHAPTPAHKDLKGAVDKERNPAAFPRRYGQQDSDVTPAWEEPSGWNHMFVPPSCVS